MNRAPLRFLLAILVLWIGARAAILLPGLPGAMDPVPAADAATRPAGVDPQPSIATATSSPPEASAAAATGQPPAPVRRPEPASHPGPAARAGPGERLALALPLAATPGGPKAAAPPPLTALSPPATGAGASRWAASAWLLVRDESGAALAPGGALGGSQAGARLSYALGGGLALSTRLSLPLRQRSGAEIAAGLDWRPVPSLPLNLLAERRQRLDRGGRNAFALTLYGGTSRVLAPRLRLDLYGQAGMVGLRRRDLFADGSVRLSRRLGPVELGAAAWGAAQPGAARLDAGPSLAWRLPVRDANLRLQADWRFRITGDAAPRSGPALTLAADF